MISKITIEPRFQETDLMGIIHHSVYPIYFEVGRIAYCKDAGMPYEDIVKSGIHLAVIDLHVDYIQSAKLGDQLTVLTTLSFLSKVKMIFTYEIFNQNKLFITKGSTTLCWLNSSLKPTNVYKSHPLVYETFLKAKGT